MSVEIETSDRTLSFTLDLEAVGNELSIGAMREMIDALERQATNSAVLRIRARGPAFCTGRERAAREVGAMRAEVGTLIRLKRAVRESPLISIAEVQGDAAGFGVGLATVADFTLIARGATLSFPEMRAGLPPAAIMAYLHCYALPKRILPLVLLGEEFSPDTALELGLATEVLDGADLSARADALADALMSLDPVALHQCKAFFYAAPERSISQNFAMAEQLLIVEATRLGQR